MLRRPVLVLYDRIRKRQIKQLNWRFYQSLMAVGALEEQRSEIGDHKGYTGAG